MLTRRLLCETKMVRYLFFLFGLPELLRNQLSATQHKLGKIGFEPMTFAVKERRSSQLNYFPLKHFDFLLA